MWPEMPDIVHTSNTFYRHEHGFVAMRLQDKGTPEVITVFCVSGNSYTTRELVRELERKYRKFLRWIENNQLVDAPLEVVLDINKNRVTVYV